MRKDSFLDVSAPPEAAEAIFVFAGRDERKRFGLSLFRAGYAPRILFSVARFEWRRFADLGLPDDGGLVERVAAVPPPERHFIVTVTRDGADCEAVPKGRLGTWTEARALAGRIERDGIDTVLLVSSRAHLPRCVVAIRSFLDRPCRLVPVPSREERGSLLVERVKLFGYWTFRLFRRARHGFL